MAPDTTPATGCIDGLVTVPTPGGPEHYACLRPCCAPRRAVQERYVEPGFTAAMLAAIPDDEPF